MEEPIRKVEENTYLVAGSTSIGEFSDRFYVETDTESVSVGGWVVDLLDCIPKVNQTFRCGDLEITVMEVEDHRVESIRVRVLEET